MTNLVKEGKVSIAAESIAFQGDKFGKALVACYEDMLALPDDQQGDEGLTSRDFDRRLAKIVKDHTNITLKVDFESRTTGPAAGNLVLSNVNILDAYRLKDEWSGYDGKEARNIADEIAKISEKHTVNIKSGWVTGVFSDIVTTLFMPDFFIYGMKLTARELTAITLHEVGHLFTYYEYASRFVTTNQILAAAAMATEGDVHDREYVFSTAGRVLNIDKGIFKDLEQVTDTRVITAVIIDESTNPRKSELGISHYDVTTSEALADQYATRYGFGRDLILGLEKLTSKWDPEKNKAMRVALFTLSILSLVTGPVIIGSTFKFATYFSALFGFGWFCSTFLGSGELNKDYTYDTTRIRFLRIKEQLLVRLKDRSISAEESKQLVKDIEEVEKVIDKFKDVSSFMTVIKNVVMKKHRDGKAYAKLQRDLESLSANDLFAAAAKFKHL